MSVDVIYQGAVLQRSASVRVEATGVYVALDSPMPVGTRLELRDPDEEGDSAEGVVVRVRESGDAPGVLMRIERGTVDAAEEAEEIDLVAEASEGNAAQKPPPLTAREKGRVEAT